MNIQMRAKNIVTQPRQEWPVIAGETADVAGLLRDYAAPLSAIGAICRWIGMSGVGLSLGYFGTYRVGFIRGFANTLVSWVLGLVGAWVAAIVIEKLAPTFKSSGNTTQALKLVVYASTPVWIAGVLNLVPALSILVLIAALYAVYIYYLGLPIVMKTPPDQVIPYMVVSALVVFAAAVIVGVITSALIAI
jgi:hypothetical protein